MFLPHSQSVVRYATAVDGHAAATGHARPATFATTAVVSAGELVVHDGQWTASGSGAAWGSHATSTGNSGRLGYANSLNNS